LRIPVSRATAKEKLHPNSTGRREGKYGPEYRRIYTGNAPVKAALVNWLPGRR